MGNDITKLVVFDFDNTLIDTPLPEMGKRIYQEKTGKEWPHKGWWGRAESLDMDIFNMPVIPSVKVTYNKEKNNPNTLLIMMTGRLQKLSNEVEKILSANGFKFDDYFYNSGEDTLVFKINKLNQLLHQYPKIQSVLLNDDREEHIAAFQAWGDNQIEMGRLKQFKINFVQGV